MVDLSKHVILLELNEINFDLVAKYVATEPKRFPALRRLLSGKSIRTTCEQKYEELEPWIQWPSVHTGLSYKEHGIFRLGDIVGSDATQVFEYIEKEGYSVGVVSAMNAENRLKKPAYFIPDPWTNTKSDGSWWSRSLSQAISQSVNDNTQAKISLKSAVQLLMGTVRFARLKNYPTYLRLISESRRKRWLKALVLDLLLHDVHWSMFKNKKPNFTTLFLNAGAHVQHHYFFNAAPLKNELPTKNPNWYVSSDQDPIADALKLYDFIVGEYFSIRGVEVVLATGLAQKPYGRTEFYYRLKTHEEFLKKLGINFERVFPRMTRDFLVEFSNEKQAQEAQALMASARVIGENAPLFGEIDNRGSSLFVTLTYANEVTAETRFSANGKSLALFPEVSFVAIKNGMHQAEGFAFFTPGIAAYAPPEYSHVSKVGNMIRRYFT